MWPKTFRDLFCEVHDCPVEDYETKVFWRSLYPHTLLVAWLIRHVAPRFFRLDFQTIQRVGLATDSGEFNQDLDRFHFLNRYNADTIRAMWRLRISGKKLIRLRARLRRQLAAREHSVRPTLALAHKAT